MILVVGGTGDLGGRVVQRLRAEARQVRCLLRSGSDDTGLRALGAQVVRGDLTERATLAAACEGIDTVIATATAITRRLTGRSSATVRAVDEEGMLALVDAAEEAGVARFVYVSFAGAGTGGGVSTPLERAKVEVERRMARSAMRPVVVRPDGFQEVQLSPVGRFDVASGKVALIGKGETTRRWVATEDVAALLVALAFEPDPPSSIEFGGPESLTMNEAVAIASEAARRAMTVQHLPRPVARLLVRVLARPNDALASALGAGLLADLREATWDDGALRVRGIDPTPASRFIRGQVRTAV
ncbi:NAD(P)H-binding protein [Amnibacterium sp. CER49]|uniref:SDR family oxidoreductase n=1 Tax=Amnibacterium sp. CER49 TaxID=3039161 RepID=UPI0024468703|nr:NAD(P)H-binding protein [Amnibacterium sp. CER49]MDH2444903.1 NAD(P)H-binding protein [Amnibacterium sp. CER49]